MSCRSFRSPIPHRATDEADPAYRAAPDHMQKMLVEIMEEGTIKWNRELVDSASSGLERGAGRWLGVGTVVGEVRDDDDGAEDGAGDDGGEEEEEWSWQAYTHDGDDDYGNGVGS